MLHLSRNELYVICTRFFSFYHTRINFSSARFRERGTKPKPIFPTSASFSRPVSRRLSAPFSRMLTRRYRMIPQKSGAEMARIRRPGTERSSCPPSLQDALLHFRPPAPSYTISGARWNIAFKSNQDYLRIACLSRLLGASERAIALRSAPLAISTLLLNDLTPLSLTS